MSDVNVQKIREASEERPLMEDTLSLLGDVQRRAYELFQSRGGVPGNEMEDWLRAEQEVFQVPRMELEEGDTEFQLQLAVPGFEAKELHVAALPDSVIVEGESTHRHSGKKGNVRICEFGERKIFRQIPLPERVDVDHVSATLDKGMLEIHAAKAKQGGKRVTA